MACRRFVRIVARHRFFCRTTKSRLARRRSTRPARFLLPATAGGVEDGDPVRGAGGGDCCRVEPVSQRLQMISLLSWLWTISGSIITLALYQRRRPLAWMDARVGARIGLVVGLALVACLGVAWGSAGVVARYGLHNLGGVRCSADAVFPCSVRKGRCDHSTDARGEKVLVLARVSGGIMLAGFGMMAGFLLILSTVGGAAGRIYADEPEGFALKNSS